MANLFGKAKSTINEHIKKYVENELEETESTDMSGEDGIKEVEQMWDCEGMDAFDFIVGQHKSQEVQNG